MYCTVVFVFYLRVNGNALLHGQDDSLHSFGIAVSLSLFFFPARLCLYDSTHYNHCCYLDGSMDHRNFHPDCNVHHQFYPCEPASAAVPRTYPTGNHSCMEQNQKTNVLVGLSPQRLQHITTYIRSVGNRKEGTENKKQQQPQHGIMTACLCIE